MNIHTYDDTWHKISVLLVQKEYIHGYKKIFFLFSPNSPHPDGPDFLLKKNRLQQIVMQQQMMLGSECDPIVPPKGVHLYILFRS